MGSIASSALSFHEYVADDSLAALPNASDGPENAHHRRIHRIPSKYFFAAGHYIRSYSELAK